MGGVARYYLVRSSVCNAVFMLHMVEVTDGRVHISAEKLERDSKDFVILGHPKDGIIRQFSLYVHIIDELFRS